MEKKTKEILIEICMRKGEVSNDIFYYDDTIKNKVNAEVDKELSLALAKAESERTAFNISGKDTTEEKALKAELELVEKCKQTLLREGMDIDRILGKTDPKQDEQEIIKELGKLGINEEQARKLGLTDAERVINNGKDFSIEYNDTPEKRKSLSEKNIDYKVDEKIKKIYINGRMDAMRGVSLNDTPQVRKLLDENEINYINMANGENGLFVPISFRNGVYGVTNSQLVKNLEKIALIAATSFIISAPGAIVLYFILNKTGLLDKMLKRGAVNVGEKKALEQGLTVYKTIKDKEGNGRYSREKEMYYYMDRGNLCSLNARDVRIPDQLKGVKLTPGQKEDFRKGKLVELTNKKGEVFAVRIDVAQESLCTMYYKDMRSDKTMRETPNKKSEDKEILDYITKKGMSGIDDVFGSKASMERNVFLDRYGMRQNYTDAKNIELEIRGGRDEQGGRKEIDFQDGKIKDLASKELARLSQNNGYKL
mgnify:CR=1 FL=1|jgi:hypothetical protein